MWSLIGDDFLLVLTDLGISYQGYVDVIVIHAKRTFESTLCDVMQRGLNLPGDGVNKCSLILTLQTTLIVFTRRSKSNFKTIIMDVLKNRS